MSNDGEIKDSACLTTLSGSSMAAAKATAVAALVRQVHFCISIDVQMSPMRWVKEHKNSLPMFLLYGQHLT